MKHANFKDKLHIGFLVNPFAGVGGPAGEKGSDDSVARLAALEGKTELTVTPRVKTFLNDIAGVQDKFKILTVNGAMGMDHLSDFSYDVELIDYKIVSPSTASDTKNIVLKFCEQNVDIIVFVGGDGTARDVCDVLPPEKIVLGVPAGVKMHSGVYAINPQSAAAVVAMLASGELVNISEQEVRDIDEVAFRQNTVKSRYYGEMHVPCAAEFVQHVKQGGIEQESLVLVDIADMLKEDIEPNTLMIFGPGSTMKGLMENLGFSGTLLGVDVCCDDKQIACDVNAEMLEKLAQAHDGPVRLFITAIGGQGHIIGRGNQQIRANLLKRIGRDQITVVATKRKLQTLEGRPLLIDSGDEALDRAWSGQIKVLTGYRDQVLYRVSSGIF